MQIGIAYSVIANDDGLAHLQPGIGVYLPT
jgi:hypothetical protein